MAKVLFGILVFAGVVGVMVLPYYLIIDGIQKTILAYQGQDYTPTWQIAKAVLGLQIALNAPRLSSNSK